MKIILDNDGTALDFNKFIDKKAIPYFVNKYGMEVVNPNALEITDILEMKSFFSTKYSTEEEINKEIKKALDSFWIGPNFIKYSLFNKFRPGYKEFVKKSLKEKHEIEIHTSRDKTCNKDLIGFIAKTCTILQYAINGIPLSSKHFHFYTNDDEKIKGIVEAKPDLVFDDKPVIINSLNEKNIKTFCVKGKHNSDVTISKNVEIIDDFNKETLDKKITKLIGIKNLKLYGRIISSDEFFNKLKIFRTAIINKFKPIVLHEENMDHLQNEAAIYAPNHRSTLDPMIITAILVKNIHWAALKRFFDCKDSIFANSKNPILCKITANSFKKLEYFPIERKCENEHANNYDSIRDMDSFLKLRQQVGIFAEGTTRRPEGQDFGTFDDSFLILAKKNKTLVRPITSLWFKELKLKNKLIINFGQPFYVEKDMSIEEAMNKFRQIQINSLKENKEYLESIIKEEKQKKLFKKI